VDQTVAGGRDSPESRLEATPMASSSSLEAWEGEERTVSLVAVSEGREVVGVGLTTKRSGQRRLELGAPVHHHVRSRWERRPRWSTPWVAQGGGVPLLVGQQSWMVAAPGAHQQHDGSEEEVSCVRFKANPTWITQSHHES
jgi:hypothetical protein